MILMISRYSKPLAEVNALRPAHLAFLDSLDTKGLIVSAGMQNPPVGGVVLLATDDEAKARTIMAQDPYVVAGLATYQPTGWKPLRGVLASWKTDLAKP